MQLLRRHWMLGTAAFVALVSMFLVPPDGAYLGYFDWKTIGCLFCVLSVAGIVFATWFMTRHGTSKDDGVSTQPQQGTSGEDVLAPAASAAVLDRRRLIVYVPLFVIALLAVFRVIPFGIAVIIVIVAFLILDRDALLKVDYPLLATFLCFFVFAGNMARIPVLVGGGGQTPEPRSSSSLCMRDTASSRLPTFIYH